MGNVIYGYKKKSSGEMVYIGQTVDLNTRHKQHIKYDPYNPNNREYNYPLSRGIRKYGEDAYELVILEDNIPRDKLNEREKYWIGQYNTYWDGYNQSTGGSYPAQPILNEGIIDTIISLLREEKLSFQEIADQTGVSLTHVYNINIGARRKRDGVAYPIRDSKAVGTKGLKLSQQDNLLIHQLLQDSTMTLAEIGARFKVGRETISDINQGKTKSYRLENQSYPIRSKTALKAAGKHKLNVAQVKEIIALLLESQFTFEQIGQRYGVGISTISGINSGKTKSYIIQGITYPIRQTH